LAYARRPHVVLDVVVLRLPLLLLLLVVMLVVLVMEVVALVVRNGSLHCRGCVYRLVTDTVCANRAQILDLLIK
jgi:hypothetical protein